jgi:hypothetical protein
MNYKDHLSRKYTLHICADGTITYRTEKEPIFNGVALPFFSVDTENEAKTLQVILCSRQYKSHPLMPNQPWYTFPNFAGEIEDIDRVAEVFAEMYEKIKK